MEIDTRHAISQMLGRIPSGLSILTVRDGQDHETGMLVSWVQQAAFEPPLVTVAVNRERYVHEWLEQSQCAALNLLGETHQQFLSHFGKGFKPGESAFDDVPIQRGVTGVPLLSGALGYLEGRLAGKLPAGDHVIYLLEIVGAGVEPDFATQRPLVHLRKNGFRY